MLTNYRRNKAKKKSHKVHEKAHKVSKTMPIDFYRHYIDIGDDIFNCSRIFVKKNPCKP